MFMCTPQVFGMVEVTEARRIVLVTVKDRTRETLESLLVKYVHPDSIIHSDCWKAYSNLKSIFASHYTVNHSLHFSDPKTNINTNAIEGNWNGIKSQVAYTHRTKKSVLSYLIRYMYRRNYGNLTFEFILRALLEPLKLKK
jgi:transposase